MEQKIAHDFDAKERTKDVFLQENVSFTSLLLSSEIKNGLSDSGFKKPSPIQFKAIPLGRCGFDLIVKSKSGTGKTLVFSTIALETVSVSKQHLQVLILVPTREIAVQIQEVLKNIGCHIHGLSVESFIGGTSVEEDVKKAKQCHIAVGAPGRVKHLINLGALATKSVRLFVLDEADKLMESAFKNDINEIYDGLPHRKQLIVTSATYPEKLDSFLADYMLSPTHVTSENETPLLLGLKQFVAVLKANAINAVQQMKAKNEILLEIFSKVSFTQCLVFTNYQSRTESVCNYLNQKGWNSTFISAAITQTERLEAIDNLKNFKNRILLSTDLTSRGIDAPNVDLVINYDLPVDAVTYLHRMGRAGRYGSSGICINFALETEIKKLQTILGTIGASNLSISKLPPLNDIDLWQIDPNSLEQIWGVVPSETSNEINENIKKEVLTLKNNKVNVKAKNKSAKKKIKLEELTNSECVQDLLKKKEQEEECLDSSGDAENLLSSLINNENELIDDDGKKRKRCILNEKIKIEQLTDSKSVQNILNCKKKEEDVDSDNLDSEKIFKDLISGTESVINEDSKKRKLDEPTENREKRKNDKKKIEADLVDSVQQYLSILKEENVEEPSQSIEEILDCNELTVKTEEIVLKEDGIDVIEDIFKIGYECAVKSEEKSWLSCLPVEELQQFQEFCKREQVTVSSESENEDDEEAGDYEMEEYAEEEAQGDSTNDNVLQWVPVVPENNEHHLAKCYEDCSNALWHTGLTFESVPDFDNWFYQWQEQLQYVRNYVQQNIYVEEMSKYQQSRLSNK